MSKKGFTLIELLAVIVILSLLALITTTSITKIVKDSKEELSNTQMKLIKSAAEAWGADNLDKLPDAGECGYITLGDLSEYGLLDSSIIDPKTNTNISENLLIKITTANNSYGNPITNYEVNADSVEGCKHSVIICELNDGYTSKTVGSKYTCNLDQERNFYVLENDSESENISLIMDRNIGSTVAWCGDETKCKTDGNWDNTKGPITAAAYLADQTSAWGVQVSLPSLAQVANSDGTNEFLYDYLDGSEWYGSGTQPTNHIEGVYGYWLSNRFTGDSSGAYVASYIGKTGVTQGQSGNRHGVRPVITISKSLLD